MLKKYFALLFCIFCFSSYLAAQEVKVKYQCAQTEDIMHRIKPRFIIYNTGNTDINLSQLTLRYFFSAEGYDVSQLSIDYAWMGNSNVQGKFFTDYLQISFATGAGILAPGDDTGEIQLRIEKLHHGNYIQSNDYSFEPLYADYTIHDRVACYLAGNLLWGKEPPPPPEPSQPPTPDDDWLHASGSQIMDSAGNPVRLTGINWFGFETNPLGLGGLQAVNWMDTFDMLTGLGFNFLRLPLSLEIVLGWKKGVDPLVQFNSGLKNPTIDQISSLGLLDKAVEYCQETGMKIMLDMHALGNNQRPPLWYDSSYSFQELIEGWQWIVVRYKNNDTVIAVDLYNEPHGQSWLSPSSNAKWDDSQDPNNWKRAAENIAGAILDINPNLLIMIEGIECTPVEGSDYSSSDKYQYYCNWWGGNLREAGKYPIDLGLQSDQIVYAPHDYGPDIYVQPWFKGSFTYQSLIQDAWGPNWLYLVENNRAPILIGEWGGKLGGDNQIWMEHLADLIISYDLNHTFWCFNPDSHDTGGLVTEDYQLDRAKYNIIEPTLWQNSSGAYIGLDHEIVLGKHPGNTNVTQYYGESNPTQSPTPTGQPTETPRPENTPAFILGDVNFDNLVDIVDSLLVAQYYVGLPVTGFVSDAADVNFDSNIDIVDALLIAQFYVGLIEL